MKYPKVDSLYKRQFTEVDPVTGETRFLDKGKSGNPLMIGDYAKAEFESVKYWTVTEKVDGTNIRVMFERKSYPNLEGDGKPTHSTLEFGGRTDNAQIPANLYKVLTATFTLEKLEQVFRDANRVVLFGEGYGGKIQAHSPYRADPAFVLFDVFIDGWWLNVSDVHEVAKSLGVQSVPLLEYNYADFKEGTPQVSTFIWTTEQIFEYVASKPLSKVAEGELVMEGVIARSQPMMMFRAKDSLPIMFKLKVKDLVS